MKINIWLKKYQWIILIIIVLIPISFLAYFQWQQKEREREIKDLFNKKKECQAICSKIYEKEKQGLNTAYMLEVNYAYNKRLNTCLYSTSVHFPSLKLGEGESGYYYVNDCFNNKAMIDWSEAKDYSFEDYLKDVEKLMNE